MSGKVANPTQLKFGNFVNTSDRKKMLLALNLTFAVMKCISLRFIVPCGVAMVGAGATAGACG